MKRIATRWASMFKRELQVVSSEGESMKGLYKGMAYDDKPGI